MKFFFHCSCLLIFALVAPIALPAGGAYRSKTEIVYNQIQKYVYAGKLCELKSSPLISSATLSRIKIGTPLKVLRVWEDGNDETWFQIKSLNINFVDYSENSSRRGWIKV